MSKKRGSRLARKARVFGRKKLRLFRRERVPESVKHFLGEGKLTQITPAIRSYAKSRDFHGKSIETVLRIVNNLVHFNRHYYNALAIRDKYAQRTADEIIQGREIAVSRIGLGLEGCIDYNTAVCAVLRAKKIPARFVRIGTHAVTHAWINGKWYRVNPNGALSVLHSLLTKRKEPVFSQEHIPKFITPLEGQSMDEYLGAKRIGACGSGLDSWDAGIRDITDYDRFSLHRILGTD